VLTMSRLAIAVMVLEPLAVYASLCPLSVTSARDVGTCTMQPCPSSRGPTDCEDGTCVCKEGYCRYPSSTIHFRQRYCVQRVPDATCHVTRFCYSAGLTTSFCEKGLCMCKFGHHLEDGVCVKTETAFALSARAVNSTDQEVMEMMAAQGQENNAVMMNILMFSMWVAAATMVTGGGLVMLRRKRNIVDEEENSEYKALPQTAPLLAA